MPMLNERFLGSPGPPHRFFKRDDLASVSLPAVRVLTEFSCASLPDVLESECLVFRVIDL